MRHFRPEVEKRIGEFRAKHGAVGLGGHLASDVDDNLAVPDDLGLRLPAIEAGSPRPQPQLVRLSFATKGVLTLLYHPAEPILWTILQHVSSMSKRTSTNP